MNMIRFTPTQLGDLNRLWDAATEAAPDWCALYRRAAALHRRALPGGLDHCRVVAGQEWAVKRLTALLDCSAAALQPAPQRDLQPARLSA